MTNERPTNILSTEPVALPPELAALTEVLPATDATWLERALRRVRLSESERRVRALRRAWTLFRRAQRFGAVVTLGDFEGFAFAALQRLRGKKRSVHVMYGCLWYGGIWPRRAWMRFCLQQVDCCIVWARVELQRYARTYGVSPEKFLYVPHHHTLKRYTYEVGDDGYIFTGGNRDRDWALFLTAISDMPVPCCLATNRTWQLSGLSIPSHVRIVDATPAEFRQLMARARVVVMPMRATLLHAGGQQTILNAMVMGKPVILTDPEGGADYIEHGKTGLLVPYGDVAALREAIRYLWEHLEEARAMGEQAQRAATPLTTERCNTVIWNHTLSLIGEVQVYT
jgi:glycosyltransferase involved in cell wall biosynthesis